jgi:hypothetical protein
MGIGTTPGQFLSVTYSSAGVFHVKSPSGETVECVIDSNYVSKLSIIDSGAAVDTRWLTLQTDGGTSKFLSRKDDGADNVGTILSMAHGTGLVTVPGTISAGRGIFGTATNNTSFELDGTMLMTGQATVWDDIRISGAQVRLGATAPSLEAFGPSGSLRTYRFETAAHQEIEFEVQMPHGWKPGRIYPHVHWAPIDTTTGNVVWQLEYAFQSIGGVFGAPATMASIPAAAGGTAWAHKLTDLQTAAGANYIDGSALGLSSMLVGRLHRDSGAAPDTLAQDVAFLEIDMHYEMDTIGSRLPSEK